MSLLEGFTRPLRGNPRFDSAPRDQAVDSLRQEFETFSSSVKSLTPEQQAQQMKPDDSWKFIANVIQTAGILSEECPKIPLPQEIEEAVLGEIAKVEGEETREPLKVHPSWLPNGFEFSFPDSTELHPKLEGFIKDVGEVTLHIRTGKRPFYDTAFDKSWLGYDYTNNLRFFSAQDLKRIDINTARRWRRPNVSLTDPRENLTFLFPRRDVLAVEVIFSSIQEQDSKTTLITDKDSTILGTGDERKPLILKDGVLVADLLGGALSQWSKQRDVANLKNWTT